MNKKQIEARIKAEASRVDIPNLKQQILAQVPNRKVVEKKEKKAFGSFGVRFSYIMSVFVIVLLAVVMFTNSNNKPFDESQTEVTPPITISKNITNTEKAYAKGAATLAGFVEGMDSGVQGLVSTASFIATDNTDYGAMAEEINKYFTAVSRLLDEDGAVYEIETLSDSEYMYKLTITTKMLNDTFETIIYYNELASDENNKNKDLDEISTSLFGLIIQNDVEYQFTGFKELEKDECNIELTLKISNDNYLTVSQEIETNEKEFEYNFHHGDKKHPYKTIEIEIEADEKDEDGNKDVSIEIEENGREIEIEFKYSKDSDCVDVKYHHEYDDDYKGFQIRENEEDRNKYSYNYKDKSGNDRSESVNKHHSHRDKDRDDD